MFFTQVATRKRTKATNRRVQAASTKVKPWEPNATDQEQELIAVIQARSKDIAKLQAQQNHDQDLLAALQAGRAPIAPVSDDVLRLILQAVDALEPDKEPIDDRRKSKRSPPVQLVCAQVCRRWRHVAFDTSSLWMRLLVQDTASSVFVRTLLQHMSCRFGLQVRLRCTEGRSKGRLIKSIANLISDNTDRLIRLHFKLCEHGVPFILDSLKQPLTSCIELLHTRVEPCSHDQTTVPPEWRQLCLARLPSLMTINIAQTRLPTLVESLPLVTRMRYDQGWCTPRNFAVLSQAFPNLTHLELLDIEWYCLPEELRLPKRFANLSNLKVLKLSGGLEFAQQCLRDLKLGRLQQLSVFSPYPAYYTLLLRFIAAQDTLAHLTLSNAIDFSKKWDQSFPSLLIRQLCKRGPDGPEFLPCLTDFAVLTDKASPACDPSTHLSGDLKMLLEARKEMQAPLHRLSVSALQCSPWLLELSSELGRCVTADNVMCIMEVDSSGATTITPSS